MTIRMVYESDGIYAGESKEKYANNRMVFLSIFYIVLKGDVEEWQRDEGGSL